jgi:NarL family two-component system response regulator LiaR
MANKIRILLADDHALVREGMRDQLEREKDLQVVGEASDGEEAVQLCTELNGIEATRLIKQANPTISVIILTAYSDIRYILGLLDAGACGYLLKSAHRDDIIGAIRAVQSGESVLDPVVTQKLLQRVVGQTDEAVQYPAGTPLTLRESEILRLAARGMKNKDIADTLFVSLRTVKAHLTNIFNKLGVGSRTDAIVKGLKEGYINLDEIASQDGGG